MLGEDKEGLTGLEPMAVVATTTTTTTTMAMETTTKMTRKMTRKMTTKMTRKMTRKTTTSFTPPRLSSQKRSARFTWSAPGAPGVGART
jgi:hypothetical protein